MNHLASCTFPCSSMVNFSLQCAFLCAHRIFVYADTFLTGSFFFFFFFFFVYFFELLFLLLLFSSSGKNGFLP